MELIKIRKGNSFPLVVTLKDNQGAAVPPSAVTGLKTFLCPQYGPKTIVEYVIANGAVNIHVTPAVASITGKYRLVITGAYAGESVDRNPYAFEIVSNVEDERPAGSRADIDIDPVLISADLVVGASGDGPVVINAVWGEITGDIESQTDLTNKLKEVENNAAADVIQEINNLGFQTKSQVADAVTSGVSNHDSNAEAHKELLAKYAMKTDIPSLDGIATENYVDDEIAKLESSALTFKGFISPAQPAGDVRDGNYWYASDQLPADFPLAVQEYNAGAWAEARYTPNAFDVWDFNGDAYYYFGSKWERLDFGGSTFNPDHFEVVNGVVRLKEVYASLPATIGNINSILDAINGEVI
jgi:hypothetical protein